MKQLVENWRRFLKEGIDSRIQKQIDMLLALPDIGVAIVSDGPTQKRINYVRLEKPDPAIDVPQYSVLKRDDAVVRKNRKVTKTGIPYGGVEIMKVDPDHDGPCLDGWTVIGSEAEQGWGPLLYEVAIEFASQDGGGLAADRFSVSQYAQAVWDKYEQRGDVDTQQMDTNPSPGGLAINQSVPQLTPDDQSDDCDQSRSITKFDDRWHEDSTSKMYKKDNLEVMEALKAAGRLILV